MGLKDRIESSSDQSFEYFCQQNLPYLYEAIIDGDFSNLLEAAQNLDGTIIINDVAVNGNAILSDTPDPPESGFVRLYQKSDLNWYYMNRTGGEKPLLVPPSPTSTLQNVETRTIANGATETFAVTISQFIKGTVLVPNIGSQLTAVGTVDPDGVSTNDANLINGVLDDLCYNISSPGSANKSLPGADFGAGADPGICRVWWWTNDAYTASNYKIQGSTNGTTWTDIATGLNSTGLAGQSVDITITGGPWRYLRVFCVTGNNATYCVISELEAFESAAGSVERLLSQYPTYAVGVDNSGFVTVENNSGSSSEITIYYL